MKRYQMLGLAMIASAALFVSACATDEGASTGSNSSDSRPASSIMTPVATGRAASGSDEDSLKACLNRIPKDASPGQHMLAEGSCKRDEANR